MARPMKFDPDKAIEAAMCLIWRNGYEASSVKAISAELGITRSSYYNTFGSRDRLFALALEHYFTVVPEQVLFTPKAEQDFPRMLTRLMREVCHARTTKFAGLGCLAANSIAELLPSDSDAAQTVREATEAMLARISELVAGALSRGEVPNDTDIEATAMAIHAMIMGINLQSKVITDEERLWASARETLTGLGLYQD